jgi:hypothetical protein
MRERPKRVRVTAYNNCVIKYDKKVIQIFDMEIAMMVLLGRSPCVR